MLVHVWMCVRGVVCAEACRIMPWGYFYPGVSVPIGDELDDGFYVVGDAGHEVSGEGESAAEHERYVVDGGVQHAVVVLVGLEFGDGLLLGGLRSVALKVLARSGVLMALPGGDGWGGGRLGSGLGLGLGLGLGWGRG
jgi:hypothetical protein